MMDDITSFSRPAQSESRQRPTFPLAVRIVDSLHMCSSRARTDWEIGAPHVPAIVKPPYQRRGYYAYTAFPFSLGRHLFQGMSNQASPTAVHAIRHQQPLWLRVYLRIAIHGPRRRTHSAAQLQCFAWHAAVTR
jgi:hypothetical protein